MKTRNDLLIDYSVLGNVKERLEVLTQERFKGKFSMQFHIQVLTKIADQFKCNENDLFEIKIMVNVLNLLVGTLIQSAKTSGVLSRDDWLEATRRVDQLMKLVRRPVFTASLKEAHKVHEPKPAGDSEDENQDMDSRVSYEVER